MASRQPMFALGAAPTTQSTRASLFSGVGVGLMAPPPATLSADGKKVAKQIRDLIAAAEAGPAGYDAVQHGARVKPGKPPTAMTLAQIDRWTRDTPGQPHAIGRYQFIPKTLRWLTARLNLPPETRFTAAVQDRLADLLLEDAGLEAVLRGEMSQRRFMRNLARTWAGFPLPNGQSYYEGFAGNMATMSWQRFKGQIGQILS